MKESVILCEGYHDRAFWAGWLEHLGCADPGKPPGKSGRAQVIDPWGDPVAGGHFGYRSKSDKFIRIFHCGGHKKVLREARNRLSEERDRVRQDTSHGRLARLIVAVDPDVGAIGPSPETGFRQEDLRSLAVQFDSSATPTDAGGVSLFEGATVVSLVRWEAADAPAAGIPDQQTLERLVCAAMVAAYGQRAAAVAEWLRSRPEASTAGPKEFAWSYMAGWYAEHGCEAFYRLLWQDDALVGQLKSRLQQSGAWQIAEALAE
ncbi:MAG: hypothetical protein ACYTG0_00050 [Planctomycetota bacterium]|jgi:hypothetical protein